MTDHPWVARARRAGDRFTVFAEGLSIATSAVHAMGGVIVTSGSQVLFLKDTDGDDRADERKVLLDGFKTYDTHAGVSNLRYGFDGWIHGTVGYAGFEGTVGGQPMKFDTGAFRFLPDGSRLEFTGKTTNNTWGLGFTESFDVLGSTANRQGSWQVIGDGGLSDKRAQILEHPAGHRREPRRFALDVREDQACHVRARHQGEGQHRHDRRGHEREEQLPVEAGAHFRKQPPARRRRPADEQVEHHAAQRRGDKDQEGERQELRFGDQMTKGVQPRGREHVDRAAIAEEEGIERARAARDRHPERRARRVRAPKRFLRERRCVRDRTVEDAAAPPVDVELDIRSLARRRAFLRRTQQRDIGVLCRDERQVRVVQHRVHDNRSRAAAAVHTQRFAGVQQPPLLRKQRRDLFDHVPVA